MTKFTLLSANFAAVLVSLLPAGPTQALNLTSFVSSTGSGTACTRAAPCGNFQAAHDATFDQGEINCLDSGPNGPYGGATFIRSMTIDCAGTAATASGFIVNGNRIVVRIRNLSLTGFGNINLGTTGIDFTNGTALYVENCLIQNVDGNAPLGMGINFRPSVPESQLIVTDTFMAGNGSGSAGGAIVVSPQSGGSALVSLDRVTVADNVFGIVADGSGSTGGIGVVIANSTVQHSSQDGIVATTPAGGAAISVTVKNTRSLNNNNGIRATGPGVTVRADGATVVHNGIGLVVNNGASLLSAGNNTVEANGVNGAFSGPYTLK